MKKKLLGILIALGLVGAVLFQVLPAAAASPGVLDEVKITPQVAAVAPSGTVQFVAQGYDDGDVAIAGLTYVWSVTSGNGTISPTGLFTATTNLGTTIIQVAATQAATATQVAITKIVTARIVVTANGKLPNSNLDVNKLTKMLGSYLSSVGFDSFLGAQWQVKNGTAVDTIKAIPGVVHTATATSLTVIINGQTTATTFTLPTTAVILPKNTTLVAGDKVMIITTNDVVTTVIKITAPTTTTQNGTLPPGLNKHGKERSEDKKTPPGWSMGVKNGWHKDSNSEDDED